MDDITIELYGYRLPFSNESIEIIKLLAKINANKKELIEDFRKFYWNCRNVVDVADKAENYIYNRLYKMCEIVAKELVEKGLFGLTTDDIFKELCACMCKINFVTDDVVGQIYKITERYDKEREYREIRKASRGKVIGGGFGLQGAVKGMVTAGTINLATGAVHSVVNSIGNIGTSIAQSNRLNELYKNGTLKRYINAIEDDANKLLEVCEKIYQYALRIEFFYNETREHEARNIYNQINENLIPDEKMKKAIAQMLFAYPFYEEYFEVAFQKLGDDNGNLTYYAQLVGFNMDYKTKEERKKYYKECNQIRGEIFDRG